MKGDEIAKRNLEVINLLDSWKDDWRSGSYIAAKWSEKLTKFVIFDRVIHLSLHAERQREYLNKKAISKIVINHAEVAHSFQL